MSYPGSTVEPSTRDDVADFRNPEPSYLKTRLGKCLTFESYTASGIVEVPEMLVPAHVLILRTGSPSIIEWRSGGREQREELAPGSISLIPAGVRHAARVYRPLPGEAYILQLNPKFFDRGIGDISKGGKLELIEHRDLRDPQIARLVKIEAPMLRFHSNRNGARIRVFGHKAKFIAGLSCRCVGAPPSFSASLPFRC